MSSLTVSQTGSQDPPHNHENGNGNNPVSLNLTPPFFNNKPSPSSPNNLKGRGKSAPQFDPFEVELQRLFDEVHDASQLDAFIAELEQNEQAKKISTTGTKTWKWFSRNCSDLCDFVKDSLNFLDNMIPENFFSEESNFSQIVKNINGKIEITNAGLKATESSFKFLELNIKYKILKQAKRLIEAKKKEKNFLTLNELEILNKWEKIISQHEKNLSQEYRGQRLTIVKNIIPSVILTLRWYPLLKDSTEKIVIEILRFLTSFLRIYFNFKKYFRIQEEIKIFNACKKKFKAWQEHISLKISISSNEPINELKSIRAEKTLSQLIDEAPILKENYRIKFQLLVENCGSDFNAVKQAIRKFDPNLFFDDVKTVEAFIQKWNTSLDWRTRIFSKFTAYEIRIAKIQYVIENAPNILLKKAANLEKMLMENRHRYNDILPNLKEFFKPQFTREIKEILNNANHISNEATLEKLKALGIHFPFDMNLETDFPKILETIKKNIEPYFDGWFFSQHSDLILKKYIEYQSTLVHTAKHTLIRVMNKKYEWQKNFLYFNRVDTLTNLIFSCLNLGSKILFDIVLRNQKMAWIATSRSIISLAKTSTNLLLGGVSVSLNYYFKPMASGILPFIEKAKLTYRKFDACGKKYVFTQNRQNLKEIIKELEIMIKKGVKGPQYEKTLKAYKTTKAKYEESRNQYAQIHRKVEEYENQLNTHSWDDFSDFVDQDINFEKSCFRRDHKKTKAYLPIDTLNTLENILSRCDFIMMKNLDSNVYDFLVNQMGLDLEQIQNDLNKDPNAMKKALQKFLFSNCSETD